MIIVIEAERLVGYEGLPADALGFRAVTEVMPGVGFPASGAQYFTRGLSGVEVLYDVDEVEVRLLWLKVSVLEVFWDLWNRPLPSRDRVIDLLAADLLNSPPN